MANHRMIKIIIESAVLALQHVKNRKGVTAVVLTAAAAVLLITIHQPDMSEYFVRRSAYVVEWYCGTIPQSERKTLRSRVNNATGHKIVIHCEGDLGASGRHAPTVGGK